jgi:hypothetical protein
MPPRSQAKHAALAAAAKGSADIRDALHGNVTAMPPVITIDAEAAPSSRKKARLTSHPLPSEGHLDIRAALEHGHARTRTALSPMSFTAAQEEALLHWGADSFAATCDAWAGMGADASPLVLLANFQLIPPVLSSCSACQTATSSTPLPPGFYGSLGSCGPEMVRKRCQHMHPRVWCFGSYS